MVLVVMSIQNPPTKYMVGLLYIYPGMLCGWILAEVLYTSHFIAGIVLKTQQK